MDYQGFLKKKTDTFEMVGLPPKAIRPGGHLFSFQSALVKWALRRGRAAIFADTGLGKTAMQLDWARHIARKGRVLILTPLAVARQTEREAARFGVDGVTYSSHDEGAPIWITNYDRLDGVDPSQFAGVVLDESSILKSFTGATRTRLIESFSGTPYRLACTATPAPNDYTELGNHSEFLGVKSRTEMLAEYFVHDMAKTQDWRVKGHAVDAFWRWVCTWGAVVKHPAEIGFDDFEYNLPPLDMQEIVIPVDHTEAWGNGTLFIEAATTLNEQRKIRRETLHDRVARIVDLVNGNEPAIVWCELNDESKAITEAIPGAVEVKGADDRDTKEDRLLGFTDGKYRVLVSKPKIAGHGMNWQHCNRIIFAGASHSFEGTYQAIRRCWRFGQTKPVGVFVIRSEADSEIMKNYREKEQRAEEMARQVSRFTASEVASHLGKIAPRWDSYNPTKKMEIPVWLTSE